MVVFSLLVIVISGGLLAVGIVSGDDVLVISSIVLSLIAAVVLFVGVWRQRDGDPEPEVPRAGENELAGSSDDLRNQASTGKSVGPGEHPDSTPGRQPFGASGDDVPVGTDAVRPRGEEPDPLSAKDHATWARSAVAAIADKAADDDAAALLGGRRTGSVDVATEIPQLMSGGSATRKPSAPAGVAPENARRTNTQRQEAVQPEPVPSEAGVEGSSAQTTQASGESVTVSAQSSDPRHAVEPTAASTETDLPRSTLRPAEEEPEADALVRQQAPLSEPPTESTADANRMDPAKARAADIEPPATDVATDAGEVGDEDAYPDPPDEPPAELLLSYEERQLGDCDVEILVVDGRPRFHLEGCLHLNDKAGEPLVLSEAAELGFTSCSLCAAATTVLAARR